MKKLLILTIMIISASFIVHAAMDPRLKECLQRGYSTTSFAQANEEVTYCVFPDGESCPLEDFNNGVCGIEYKMEDYCVKEGMLVWDADKCCEGTESYLPVGWVGQPRCQQVSFGQKLSDEYKYRPFLKIAIIILAVLIALAIIWIFMKKKRKKK